MTLVRGFGARAERIAAQCRADAGVGELDRVDIRVVANAAGIAIANAADLIELARLEEIEHLQTYSFSACTFEVEGRKVIVYNPIRTPERTNSDIAHELSHLLLEHELSEVQNVGGVPFRTCLPDQEEEATALGAALLLPEKRVMAAARRGATVETLARSNEVTTVMAQFRWNKLGVARRLSRGQSTRTS